MVDSLRITPVRGDIQAGLPDVGEPLKIGGKAFSGTPTPVDDGDRVDAWFDLNGALHMYAENPSIQDTDDQAIGVKGLAVGGKYLATPTTINDGDFGQFLIDSQRRIISRILGDTAHDAVDAGDPVKIGGKASSSIPTAVANADRVNAYFDVNGRLATFLNGANGTATIERAATFDTNSIAATNIGLTVNARAHQIWSSTHVDSGGGDDNFYAQNMDSNGNLCANISSIRGVLIRDVNGTGTAPPPLPMGGRGVSSPPSAVTSGRPQNAYFDLNGRLCIFSDQNLLVIGALAHDAANTAANNPSVQGFEAIAHGTNPTAVAAGDVSKAYANRHGVPFAIAGHPNIVTKEFSFTTSQTNAALITVSSGTKIVVTKISCTVSNACTVNVAVRVGFGTSTIPATSGSGATGLVLTHPNVAPGSGVVEGAGGGIIGIGADDEDLRITCGAATGGEVRVLVTYYTIES